MQDLPTFVLQCPYCWQHNELIIDASPEPQTYVEDCQICCRPMVVTVETDLTGKPHVEVRGEDD